MSKLATLPGQGLPEWTEMGQASGLDPLGMARPTEVVYQSLLPGISTITNRLRYYSFFPWILDRYARDSGSTSREEFFQFQRRSEALFALVGVAGRYNNGLSGANWASGLLVMDGDVIDFGATAERLDGKGYLKNKGGALGAIYGPQLREMNLVGSSSKHDLPVTTERGDRMATCMAASIGPAARVFVHAVQTGRATRSDIEAMSVLKPSAIEPGSPEQAMLAATLLGDLEDANEVDVSRRGTMLRILRYARESGALPSAYALRWAWFSGRIDTTQPSSAPIDPWVAYQANDLLRLGYETLLKRAVEILEVAPGKSSRLGALLEGVIEEVSGSAIGGGGFVSQPEASASTQDISGTIENVGDTLARVSDEAITGAINLIRMMLSWAQANRVQVDALFPRSSPFQSLSSELAFVEQLGAIPTRHIVEAIVRERILKRHLWVASRKFSGQSAYTYLFEPDDGQLRYRSTLVVAPSSPRLTQAIQFLEDAQLLDQDAGISSLGADALDAA